MEKYITWPNQIAHRHYRITWVYRYKANLSMTITDRQTQKMLSETSLQMFVFRRWVKKVQVEEIRDTRPYTSSYGFLLNQ